MATLAYVLLPVTGLLAYLTGSTERVRFHGLQAIAVGTLWPAALFAASWISAPVTQAVFGAGVLTWIALIALSAAGRDPRLPGLRGLLVWAARTPPAGSSFGAGGPSDRAGSRSDAY